MTKNSLFIRIKNYWATLKARLTYYGIRLKELVSYVKVSLIGTLLAIIFFNFPPSKEALTKFANYDTIFVAAGTLIGTILTLVFSLSVIPIQHSAEHFSGSITRLYTDDFITKSVFFAIALFCILSFIMAVNGIMGLTGSNLLLIQLIILSITFDLISLYERRIASLFQSTEAIRLLFNRIKKYIDKAQKMVSKYAKIACPAKALVASRGRTGSNKR